MSEASGDGIGTTPGDGIGTTSGGGIGAAASGDGIGETTVFVAESAMPWSVTLPLGGGSVAANGAGVASDLVVGVGSAPTAVGAGEAVADAEVLADAEAVADAEVLADAEAVADAEVLADAEADAEAEADADGPSVGGTSAVVLESCAGMGPR